MNRVYICHTFYHAYISVIKELNKSKEERGNADIILSTMSNDFGSLADRLQTSGVFAHAYMFNERKDEDIPEVMEYKRDRGNVVLNFFQRIKYVKLLGKAQEGLVPVDLSTYNDIYVFCDSDPIGYYLNYKKIYYHAVEDGLDTLLQCDDARYNNRGFFGVKKLMSRLGVIFIENGYSRYCLDMEVNNTHDLPKAPDNYIEVPRKTLIDNVKESDKHLLMEIFMENSKVLLQQISQCDSHKNKVMILTEPLCDLDTRLRIFRDIVDEYGKDSVCFIKPHPRDELDYDIDAFSDCIVLKGRFPMEIMNYIPELHMDMIISVFTPVDAIQFADKKVWLGEDFMDKYEDPAIHRQNEYLD